MLLQKCYNNQKTHKENIEDEEEWRLSRIIKSKNTYVEAIEEMSKGRNPREVAKGLYATSPNIKIT